MSVNVYTAAPAALLAEIKAAIDEGKIDTWEYDADGDFTHKPTQWRNQAWLRPVVRQDRLVLTIVPTKTVNVSTVVYAVFHGRFIEMLLSHFDSKFTTATASAQIADGDKVAASG
jgi:hypothetical protein